MGGIAIEVERAAQELALPIERLGDSEGNSVRAKLEDRYAAGVRFWPLWESTRFPVAVHDADAWKWIGEFLGVRRGILLFNPTEDATIFRVPDGASLNLLLGETFGFEFYVSDDALSFVFCFNHHDMLLAAGAASSWLARKIDSVGPNS